jgi:protein O-GlcNAc transferase
LEARIAHPSCPLALCHKASRSGRAFFAGRAHREDRREANVRALNQLGYEAHCLPIEALDQRARYSVISMADVLEHMPFPKPGLAAAHRLPRRDGVLFLSMPNMDNTVWRRRRAIASITYWGEIEHNCNFSRKRLYALLQEQRVRPVEYHISERCRLYMEVIAVKRGERGWADDFAREDNSPCV